jgi:hypothetical protein
MNQPHKGTATRRKIRKRRLITLAYAVGLAMVFVLSLLLLPHDSGLGKLLWGA